MSKSYQLKETSDFGQFHAVLKEVYRGNKQYVFPLQGDIESILSDKNKAYDGTNLKLWVVLEEGKRPVGRVAAFIDRQRNEELDLPVGGLGFFESIENDTVAELLFDAAEKWLREEGMQAVDGPINFGERDKFWGLLTKGWYRPLYQETYNPPYYQRMFEDRNYVPHEQCLTMRGIVSEFPGDRLAGLAGRVREKYGLYTKQIDKNDLPTAANDFAEAYNAAFNHWPYFKPMSGEDVLPTFKEMKPIMDPHLTCLAYNKDDRPIGLAGLIPDINCFMKDVNGKLDWKGLPRFLYRLKFQKKPRNCKGIAFGIVSEYQRMGVYPLMVDAMFQSGNRHTSRTYKYVDMATIRGHNEVMIKTCQKMNTDIHREHIAYRKALTKTASWEPFAMVDLSEMETGVYGKKE
ncbi:hypothetical protein FUA23_10245 [Neolewinella aurantiaca]|uniref:N-acetyltransferase domain-containing protein n=1 Tax=Neolewinella aurantiaca TaxID=2602767 RepID=A0A5C7FIH1_9BACT|nr:hypothetical protein [Neolewinella aurantiaca]TXF89571.1 hypothetical protein FUA23_10245 [Neolewinella aurantiaca]